MLCFPIARTLKFPGHTRSENALSSSFENIFSKCKRQNLIATFASNIHRSATGPDVAKQFNRKVALVGRSMAANARIAVDRGYLKVPENILVDMKELEHIPDEKVTVLSTGSQGEPMSALSLMASERHKYLKVKEGTR